MFAVYFFNSGQVAKSRSREEYAEKGSHGMLASSLEVTPCKYTLFNLCAWWGFVGLFDACGLNAGFG